MRITNGMLINNTLNGLYSNMNGMNKLYAQMTTGKKIQTVSDDPIIAGRSLKLKTTVLETTQYESNAKEAASWMEVTEASLNNIRDIIDEIRTKCVQGANGSLTATDKAALKTDIAQLYKQILQEANATYSGRYVFSGYKTNEPPVLTKSTQLEEQLTVQKDMSIPAGTDIAKDSVIADKSTYGAGSVLGVDTVVPNGSTLTAGTTLSAADAQALLGIIPTDDKYKLAADYTIAEGTELSKEAAQNLGLVGQDYDQETYTIKQGGHTVPANTELNKATAEELSIPVSKDTYTLTSDYQLTGDLKLQGNLTLGSSCTINGTVTLKGDSSLAGGTVLAKGTEIKEGSTLPKGAFNPKVYGKTDGQEIAYEVGVNNTININTLGLDSTLSNVMASLEEMYTMIESAIDAEGNIDDKKLYDLFNKKIGEMDNFLADISEKTADLGSRMARVEYIGTRLTEQKTTFKTLLSETEDIDIEEAYVEFNVQYATYQSALQATSKVIMNTLADYL